MPGDVAATLPDDGEAARPAGALPHGLRLLWIGGQEPSWVGLALRLDAEGCSEPRFCWAPTAGEALTRLRNENFDCVLVADSTSRGDRPALDDPIDLLRALRRSGYGDPILMISPAIDDALHARLCELDCDVLITSNSYDSPALLPMIRRAVRGAERARENHRLSVVHQRRMVREREEAEQLLQQQRGIIAELECPALPGDGREPPPQPPTSAMRAASAVPATPASGAAAIDLPQETGEFYHELLRTYVMMGSGSLAAEIAGFADLVVAAGIGPRQVLQFHLARVEALVRDLGNRSARHVMARAELLALELMIHIGEGYRQRQPAGSTADDSNEVS